jgi:hypothetical protein
MYCKEKKYINTICAVTFLTVGKKTIFSKISRSMVKFSAKPEYIYSIFGCERAK